jgi:hypothetical protein
MKLWLNDSQVIKHNLNDADLKDCDYDTVRLGYWVESDSPRAVWLTLKGLTLRRLHYNPDNIPPKITKNDTNPRTS